MRFLTIYLLALFALILSVGFAHSEPRHGTQPGYEVWGTSHGIPEVWFTEDTEDENILGIVTHYNQDTAPKQGKESMITLETPEGPILLNINRTPNIDCSPDPCPDSLEIYDLPAGYVAVPSFHIVEENSFGHMTITRYSGM